MEILFFVVLALLIIVLTAWVDKSGYQKTAGTFAVLGWIAFASLLVFYNSPQYILYKYGIMTWMKG